ncbi:hypothetical protein AVEN_95384-1 [Araneus ventricosus]|uniref:Uncharacterized protein n=1 Tax=Araneus ventricosus TaxID=182803 RepID=A0A4Y2CHR7_ARAVE|nr:hypothetical protein AVEN_95384-1 [Araneus ventricosus]
MGDYLRNTLFVEDLLEFLFNLEGIPYKAKEGVHHFKHELGKSPFDPVIGKAVDKLSEVFHKQLKESYYMLMEKGIKDKVAFSKYALIEANECFTEGYTHEHFLAYCVQVLGIPGMYYYPSSSDIVDSASQVVALVLFSYQMTGEFYRLGGWSSLTEVARKIDDRLPNDDTDDK